MKEEQSREEGPVKLIKIGGRLKQFAAISTHCVEMPQATQSGSVEDCITSCALMKPHVNTACANSMNRSFKCLSSSP